MTAQDIQDTMRKKVIKIIILLTAMSAVVVTLVFVLTSMGDSGLGSTIQQSNNRADYDVPEAWYEDSRGPDVIYTNAESIEISQATFAVYGPERASIEAGGVSASDADEIAERYRREANGDNATFEIGDPTEVEVSGFAIAYDFEISGMAADGITEVRGQARLLFDEEGYVHLMEFLSVRSYWDSNSEAILGLIESYTLSE